MLPSRSTSQWGKGGSQSRLCSLVFAKVVLRRPGPRGTSGLLLRKESWRANCFCYPQSGVPESSKHNTPPSSPATLAWPLPFGIPALLSAQALLPAHFSTLFLPYSLGGGPGFRPLGCGSGVVALMVVGWGPQPSAAGHKPLAPNWQLEAVGGVRSWGLGMKNPNRDLSWWPCGSQGWCSLPSPGAEDQGLFSWRWDSAWLCGEGRGVRRCSHPEGEAGTLRNRSK